MVLTVGQPWGQTRAAGSTSGRVSQQGYGLSLWSKCQGCDISIRSGRKSLSVSGREERPEGGSAPWEKGTWWQGWEWVGCGVGEGGRGVIDGEAREMAGTLGPVSAGSQLGACLTSKDFASVGLS